MSDHENNNIHTHEDTGGDTSVPENVNDAENATENVKDSENDNNTNKTQVYAGAGTADDKVINSGNSDDDMIIVTNEDTDVPSDQNNAYDTDDAINNANNNITNNNMQSIASDTETADNQDNADDNANATQIITTVAKLDEINESHAVKVLANQANADGNADTDRQDNAATDDAQNNAVVAVNNDNNGNNGNTDGKTDNKDGNNTIQQTTVTQQEYMTYEVKEEVTDLVNTPKTSTAGAGTNNTSDNETGGKSKTQHCCDKSGNYLFIGLITTLTILLIICISLNGANGVLSDNGDELGVLIGLTVLTMVLTPILLITVGYYGFILTIHKSTAILVLFVTLFLLLLNFVYFAIYLPQYSFFYILYVVIKFILLYQFYIFGKIDVKFFGSSIIDEYLRDNTFLVNETKIIRIWPLVVLIIFIQMVLYIFGCLAFVGDSNNFFELKIVTFFLLLWTIKSLTYGLHWIGVRIYTYVIDTKSRFNIKTNDSKSMQRVRSWTGRSATHTTHSDGQTADTVTATIAKNQTVELEENGGAGAISATNTKMAAASVAIEVKDGNTIEQALGNAIEITKEIVTANDDETTNKAIDGGNTEENNANNNTESQIAESKEDNNSGKKATDDKVLAINSDKQESTQIKSEFDIESKTDENFDTIFNAISEVSTKIATVVSASLPIALSGIPNVIANVAQAAKIVSVFLYVCCSEMHEEQDKYENRSNACCFIAFVARICQGIAWLLEKISQFLLSYCQKMILTSSAFRKIPFCEALSKQRSMVKEAKSKHGSKMVLLDNALAQHITHINLLFSSLGAWICIWAGYPEYAPLIHIAGYLAGRTTFELIDVLLQLWLVIFHLDPVLLNNNEVVYNVVIKRIIDMEKEVNGTIVTQQEIEFEIQAQVRAHKYVDDSGNVLDETQDLANITQTHSIRRETKESRQKVITNDTGNTTNIDNGNNTNNNVDTVGDTDARPPIR